MSVQIEEVEVVPREPGETQSAAPPAPAEPKAPSHELAHEIAQTVAILRSRDLRLHAD